MRLAAREYLEQGYLGLIVEMGPRHGKSELATHFDTVWYLGAFPEHRVALVSYEADFAAGWGRKARDTLEEWGPEIFGVTVSRRSSAANRWDLRGHAGGMVTAGVGGSITGRGADYLKYDDPFKNAEQANSQAYRDKVWEHWQSTARTRIEPDGVALVIQTRWHEDDLVGRLLRAQDEDEDADRWVRVRFPSLAEEKDVLGRKPGEALWPERYDEAKLRRLRAVVGSYWFSALYQQRPAPRSGGMFERGWFKIVDRAPEKLKQTLRVWDFAATDAARAADPDYTVGAKMARTSRGQLVVLDVVRFRGSPADVEERVAGTAELDGHDVRIHLEEERGAAGKHVVSHYARNVLRGYSVRGERATGSKELRAEILSAAAERGDVLLVRAPWNSAFLEEHESFPFGSHDDIVTATSWGAIKLTERSGQAGSW